MKKVLITGASGQLGQCFRKQAGKFPELDFHFTSSEELDLSQLGLVRLFFEKNNFDVCINCAAYTNVEAAESKREMAFLINAEAVKNLAEICRDHKCELFHFSTDYVFDGSKDSPYKEEDQTNPINVYGASKLAGEDYIAQVMEQYFIFRISWLYSDFGKNFFRSILGKAQKDAVFKITAAQKGTPTNAHDLAVYVLQIISGENQSYGLYHYSNLGEATWYDFAKEILRGSGQLDQVDLIEDSSYKTIAKRPPNSVLSKEKTLGTFKPEIVHWKDSLKLLMSKKT